jgi:DNA-binding LacI/PurR family transcriptional regulator
LRLEEGARVKLTADDAARLIGVSRATVFRMLKDDRLAGLTVEAVLERVRKEAYEAGRRAMLDELRRAGRIRRRDHKAVRSLKMPL